MHHLRVLDSLRILSDHIGLRGDDVMDMVKSILASFERSFGRFIAASVSFSCEQLHAACMDYVRLGYSA